LNKIIGAAVVVKYLLPNPVGYSRVPLKQKNPKLSDRLIQEEVGAVRPKVLRESLTRDWGLRSKMEVRNSERQEPVDRLQSPKWANFTTSARSFQDALSPFYLDFRGRPPLRFFRFACSCLKYSEPRLAIALLPSAQERPRRDPFVSPKIRLNIMHHVQPIGANSRPAAAMKRTKSRVAVT
jgi:hypothetical protein